MAAAKSTIVGYIMRGWHEAPELVISPILWTVGSILGFMGLYRYNTMDGDNKKFKTTYTVYRPDDPRVKRIRLKSGLDY